MDTLLFLAHRLPYPPNKGDKVRSYHLLRHLAQRYRIALGTFVDDPTDWQYIERIRTWCAEVYVEPIVPWTRRLKSLTGVLTGEAVTLPYFRSARLRGWVQDVVRRERIERAFAYSSPMAQYVLDSPLRCVIDFVDLDSAKWGDYAQRRPWPLSSFYRREARRLLAYEKSVAARTEASLFVTRDEARLLGVEAPDCTQRIVAIENGVDSDYFSPAHHLASPFSHDEHALVFTGTMDYWPNVDAVTWFAREVLPRVRRLDPRVRFHVVGMKPQRAVRALQSEAVNVTGRVDDVRPYLLHARAVVAPMQVARGIQNKVLEAMAMGRPVIVSPAAASALNASAGIEFEVADDAVAFAAKTHALMDPPTGEAMGRLARARILADYAWPARFARLDELFGYAGALQSAPASASGSPRHATAAVDAR
jgi:sugar transferase (PEP-CTERM/EpsH1 system associated)